MVYVVTLRGLISACKDYPNPIRRLLVLRALKSAGTHDPLFENHTSHAGERCILRVKGNNIENNRDLGMPLIPRVAPACRRNGLAWAGRLYALAGQPATATSGSDNASIAHAVNTMKIRISIILQDTMRNENYHDPIQKHKLLPS